MIRRWFSIALAFGLAGAAPAEPAPQQKPGFTLADLKAQIPQNVSGAFLMELPQILNTVTDPEVQGLLAGQSIETSGQLMPDPSNVITGEKRWRLFRTELLCCSTHARECSVALVFPAAPPALENLAWVTLHGVLTFQPDGKRKTPLIEVQEISPASVPGAPPAK